MVVDKETRKLSRVIDWAKRMDEELEKIAKMVDVKVITTAAPYRSTDVSVFYDWDKNLVTVDFYSVIQYDRRQVEALEYAKDLIARLGIIRKQLIAEYGKTKAKKEFDKFRKKEFAISEELWLKKLREVLGK